MTKITKVSFYISEEKNNQVKAVYVCTGIVLLLYSIWFITEDIDNWSGTEEDILKAQRQVVAIGGCFLSE